MVFCGKRSGPVTIEESSKLHSLLSRLDLANDLAKKGYSINLDELVELTKQPSQEIEKRSKRWVWRDWVGERIDQHRWRLNFPISENLNSKESKNE